MRPTNSRRDLLCAGSDAMDIRDTSAARDGHKARCRYGEIRFDWERLTAEPWYAKGLTYFPVDPIDRRYRDTHRTGLRTRLPFNNFKEQIMSPSVVCEFVSALRRSR